MACGYWIWLDYILLHRYIQWLKKCLKCNISDIFQKPQRTNSHYLPTLLCKNLDILVRSCSATWVLRQRKTPERYARCEKEICVKVVSFLAVFHEVPTSISQLLLFRFLFLIVTPIFDITLQIMQEYANFIFEKWLGLDVSLCPIFFR